MKNFNIQKNWKDNSPHVYTQKLDSIVYHISCFHFLYLYLDLAVRIEIGMGMKIGVYMNMDMNIYIDKM